MDRCVKCSHPLPVYCDECYKEAAEKALTPLADFIDNLYNENKRLRKLLSESPSIN